MIVTVSWPSGKSLLHRVVGSLSYKCTPFSRENTKRDEEWGRVWMLFTPYAAAGGP